MKMPVLVASIAVSLALLKNGAMAQGSLTPPGPPGPTMYSLQNIHDEVAAMSQGWGVLTNALGQMDWSDIYQTWQCCVVLTQQIQRATNAFAGSYMPALSNAAYNTGLITNALAQMDWNDILALTAAMATVTQRVDAIATIMESINWGSLSNISTDMTVITNALGQMDWNDVLAILGEVDQLGTRMHGVEAQLDEIHRLALQNNAILRSLTNAPAP